jgi:deoxyguanosine kinase
MFAYIALGSNIGARSEYIRKAFEQIGKDVGFVDAVSALYETKPLVLEGEDSTSFLTYYNAVLRCETDLSPEEILKRILLIEDNLGRTRTPAQRWEPRTIDLDLLFVGDRIIRSDSFTLPHPGILSRDFVLVPLCDIDINIVHPETGRTIGEHLKELKQTGDKYIIGLAPTSIIRGKKNNACFFE